MAQGDRNLRPFGGKDLAHSQLMGGIDDRPQQADGDRLHVAALEIGDGIHDILFDQWLDFPPQSLDPAANLVSAVPRHIRRRIVDVYGESTLARGFADREYIGVTRVADQADRSCLALDQRIGRNRRAVHDQIVAGEEFGKTHVVMGCRQSQRIHKTDLELARCGWRLENFDSPAGAINDQIRERTADIDTRCEH